MEIYLNNNYFETFINLLLNNLKSEFTHIYSKKKLNLDESLSLKKEYDFIKNELLLYVQSESEFAKLGSYLELLTSETKEIFTDFKSFFENQLKEEEINKIADCRSFT